MEKTNNISQTKKGGKSPKQWNKLLNKQNTSILDESHDKV